MATKNPRVQVMLSPEQFEILTRFSGVMGQSRSAVCAEILSDIFPMLEKLANAVEIARTLETEAKEGWRASLLEKISPEEMRLEFARDNALQAMHSVFQTLESSLSGSSQDRKGTAPRAGRTRSGSGAGGSEPPSL